MHKSALKNPNFFLGQDPQTPLTRLLLCMHMVPLHVSAHYHNAYIWNMFAVCTPIRFTQVPPPPIKILGIVRPREMWRLVSYSVDMVSYSSYLRKTLNIHW